MSWLIRREWFAVALISSRKISGGQTFWMPDGVSETECLFSPGLWVLQIHHPCTSRGIFRPWVGGLVQGHIAIRAFSEECFPCLSPTTVFVVVPDARLHILFTQRKRRKNEEIEAHSLHTAYHPDADLSTLKGSWISQQSRCDRPFLVSSSSNLTYIIQRWWWQLFWAQ